MMMLAIFKNNLKSKVKFVDFQKKFNNLENKNILVIGMQ